jgi:hypothetical protein
MAVVAVASVVFFCVREWDKRFGRGKPYWDAASRMADMATYDRRCAQEFQDCPKLHSPWRVRFQCPGCIACTTTPAYKGAGIPPDYVHNDTPDSENGRRLQVQFLESHERVARECLEEAAAYERVARKFFRAASEAEAPMLSLTREEEALQGGSTFWEKYGSDQY